MIVATLILAMAGSRQLSKPPEATAILAKSSREDKDGWIILHLSGSPHDIGFQQGALAAKEIDSAVKTFAFAAGNDTGHDWAWYKSVAQSLFWNKLDPEYQVEIAAIAEGAQSKGVMVSTADILALNSYIELSDYYVPIYDAKQKHAQVIPRAPLACSAFVATGSSTKDGKVVMGHNFWWGYLTGEHWNVILDIRPAKGCHIMMDAVAGFIESGTDWAINDKGIGLCETTIADFTAFDENGIPEFERMRKAIQYGTTLDEVAHIFKAGNNGAYANTWLMVDGKTNEIGKLELGLKNVIFSTSTDGYYFGANFPEDPKLIREETPNYHAWKGGETRQDRWRKHLDGDKGKIDAALAQSYIADSFDAQTQKPDGGGGALCGKGGGGGAINGKVLTADSLFKMQFWARMGIPDGSDLIVSRMGASAAAMAYLYNVKGEPWTLITGSD
ncbi:MAG: C45 family autoproteolytic acyltransferase/hydrolase [Fimbriimonadaceae bacterium]